MESHTAMCVLTRCLNTVSLDVTVYSISGDDTKFLAIIFFCAIST